MAVLMTIEGTSEQGLLVRDAICANYNYQENVTGEDGELVPNPESKAEFARRMILKFIKENVRKYRADEADAARIAALAQADTEADGVNVN